MTRSYTHTSAIKDSPDFAPRMLLIDVLRLLAALAVWLYHSCYLYPTFEAAPWSVNETLLEVARYGYLGVPIFFMISGFVIASSGQGRTRFAFARARAARLYPAFLLSLIPTLIALIFSRQPISVPQIGANLTMVPKFLMQDYLDPVYWSLMFEILFYGFVALLVISPRFVTRIRVFAAVWILLAFVNSNHVLPLKTILILEWSPYFCIGIFAWLMARERRLIDQVLWLVAIAVSAVLAAAQAKASPLYAAIIVSVAGLSLPAVARAHIPRSLAKPALIGGAISYPLYLIHNIFGGWLAKTSGSFMFTTLVVLGVCYLITVAEAPLRRRMAGQVRLQRRAISQRMNDGSNA